MPFMYKVKDRLAFPAENDNMCAFQDNPIFNCKLSQKVQKWLDLAWNFSNGIRPSMYNCVFQ